MNKSFQYLYSIIFWTLRFITLSIFGIYFFAVLNAKYIWSETFFTTLLNTSVYISYYIHSLINSNNINFVSVLKSSFYTAPTESMVAVNIKYLLYSRFCTNAQQVDILLLLILLIFFVSISIRKFYKKSVYGDLILIFVVYSLVYLYTSLSSILFVPLITLSLFFMTIFINKCNKIKKIIKYIPILSELFCIDLILNKILNKKINKQSIIFIILIESLIYSNMLYFIIPFKNDNFVNRIIDNNIYSINFLKDKIILATSPITILHDDGSFSELNNANFGYVQDIIVNNYKNEIILYDHTKAQLIFFSIDSLKVISILDFTPYHVEKSFGRICCDEAMTKLLICFEDPLKFGAFLVDLNKHTIIKKYKISSPRDYIIYNKYRNSFINTFHQLHDVMQEIKCDTTSSKKVEIIKAAQNQGYICISDRNKEVYVAFHQQGRIGVYDAQTMKLKRKIKSNYTVKDITYDEELNILIAPSYFTGYVDIFLMDGTDRLLTREFIGYELREARFDFKKENLYVCSRNGLYKKKIDIKKIIEKVSHETK